MANEFDPYYQWLGIPPKDQPPHHYRLLGIDVFEDNANVIEAAAERQSTYLHELSTGPNVKESQKLLNEIAAARLCLLSPDKRAAYDAELKTKIDAAVAVDQLSDIDSSNSLWDDIGSLEGGAPSDTLSGAAANTMVMQPQQPTMQPMMQPGMQVPAQQAPQRKIPWLWIGVGSVVALVVLVVVVFQAIVFIFDMNNSAPIKVDEDGNVVPAEEPDLSEADAADIGDVADVDGSDITDDATTFDPSDPSTGDLASTDPADPADPDSSDPNDPSATDPNDPMANDPMANDPMANDPAEGDPAESTATVGDSADPASSDTTVDPSGDSGKSKNTRKPNNKPPPQPKKVGFVVLKPEIHHMTRGAALETSGDVVVAGAQANDAALYSVKAKTNLKGVTALRLEAVPDGASGPGLGLKGKFAIQEMRVFASPLGNQTAGKEVKLSGAFSTDVGGAERLVDGETRYWAVLRPGTTTAATICFQSKVVNPGDTEFIVQIVNQAKENLGRFRISATADPEWLGLKLPLRVNLGGRSLPDRNGDWIESKAFATGSLCGHVGGETKTAGQDSQPADSCVEGLTAFRSRVPYKGKYTVSLVFCEWWEPNRQFSVTVEKKHKANGVKIVSLAKGRGKVYTGTFRDVEVNDGVLDIEFKKMGGFGPILNAVEIKPQF